MQPYRYAPRSNQQSSADDNYFPASRANEMNDLKARLRSLLQNMDESQELQLVIKCIIRLTTTGVDTSRFYTEMVMASGTKDLIAKKLIYLYLSLYSRTNQDSARMAINTLSKDTVSPEPKVRAMAIKHLANLRLKDRRDYVLPILKHGLNDFSTIVKKSCVMGLTKLAVYDKTKKAERDEQILNVLYGMIKGSEPDLICCLLLAIQQIEPEGIVINKKLIFYLLETINIYDELQLPVVLWVVELYDPVDDEQSNYMMKQLYTRFKTSNLAITLAISSIFLKCVIKRNQFLQPMMEAIRSALMPYLMMEVPEIVYVALKHIKYLIETQPINVFAPHAKKFLLAANDPFYIKEVKIEIITLCVRDNNFADIVNELAEYLIDESVVQIACRSLQRIIFQVTPAQAKFTFKTVLKIFEQSARPDLSDSCAPLIRSYLRLYPADFPLLASTYYNLVDTVRSTKARCAVIDLIGDFGEHIEDAVETIGWNDAFSLNEELKICLLRANVKLFLKRPVETVNVLKNLFAQILNSEHTHLQVRDYTVFLYRAMLADIQSFKVLFTEKRTSAKVEQVKACILKFNSFEVLYSRPEIDWLAQPYDHSDGDQVVYDLSANDVSIPDQEEVTRKRLPSLDLSAKFNKLEAQNFDFTFELSSQEYGRHWSELEVGASITRVFRNTELVNEEDLEEIFEIWKLTVIASSTEGQEIKIYLYTIVNGLIDNSGLCCIEFTANLGLGSFQLIVKSPNEDLAGFVSKYIEEFLLVNEVI